VYDNPAELFPSIEKNMPGGKSVIYLPSVTVQIARKPLKDDGGVGPKLPYAAAKYEGLGLYCVFSL
jgi:hypothetical protein